MRAEGHRARERIAQRIVRVGSGPLDDAKFFDGIGEMRIDYGPGYCIYFAQRGKVVVILLCGGDERSQDRDIRQADQMAKEL